MKRILIDSQIFDIQKYGGVSRYYIEIFISLLAKNKIELTIPICYTNNVYLSESISIKKRFTLSSFYFLLLSFLRISIRKKIKKANRKLTIDELKNKQFDLFIPTYYDPYFLDFIGDKPFVLTVYDMNHELFPEYFDDSVQLKQNKYLLIQKATKIIAVSHNTKNDIIRLYPEVDASKIEVIYHGSSIKVNHSISVDLPNNFILFVGVRDKYKNFNFLLDSIHELLKSDPTLYIVCAGGGEFSKEETLKLNQLQIQNQVIQKSFNEDELGLFYSNAKCFVFPSMYEGFGIPVLEAMACECPIVLTNNSSFPEVAGDAGVFFELNNSNDLKNKIKELLDNENLRKEYSEKGLKQVQKFNWEVAANQCFELYTKAIEKNKQKLA